MLLELRDVGRIFARGPRLVVALEAVSLGLDPSDCVAVYGSSRSGKSTLLRLAAGADRPTSESVRYEGPIWPASPSATHADETLRSTSLVRLDKGRLTTPTPPKRADVIDLAARKAAGDRAHA